VRYVRPQGPGVRVDDGFEEGMVIPIYYDPMIAKLITWGENREQSIQRMIRAIDEYIIVGCETTLPFGKFVMQHEAFVSGNFDTHFVKHFFTPDKLTATINHEEAEAAAVVAYFLQNEGNNSTQVAVDATNKRMGSAWRLNRS
jgi:propionyl-CoA carboxylase alpha chain